MYCYLTGVILFIKYSYLINNFHVDVWFQITNDNNPSKTFEQFYLFCRRNAYMYANLGPRDMGVMALKTYFTLPKTPRLVPFYQMIFV